MAIEKGLYAAPLGMDEEVEAGADLEIEIVDPEMVTLDDGSVEITIIPDADMGDMVPFDANLAEVLEDNVLNKVSDDLIGSVDADTHTVAKIGRTASLKVLMFLALNMKSVTSRGKARVVCTLQSLLKRPYASKQKPCLRHFPPLAL